MSHTLLVFRSIHHVLAAESALKAAGLAIDLIPVPKEINPNCGMAITIDPADRARAMGVVREEGLVEVIEGWDA